MKTYFMGKTADSFSCRNKWYANHHQYYRFSNLLNISLKAMHYCYVIPCTIV